MHTPKKLPTALFAAHEWTSAAGEIEQLRDLTGDALATYCAESAANCASEGDGDVTAGDLSALHDWLQPGADTRTPGEKFMDAMPLAVETLLDDVTVTDGDRTVDTYPETYVLLCQFASSSLPSDCHAVLNYLGHPLPSDRARELLSAALPDGDGGLFELACG